MTMTATGFPQPNLQNFNDFLNDILRQKSKISKIILNARKRKYSVLHVKQDFLTHSTSTKECFSKLKCSLGRPEMVGKCPFLYNLLWLLLATVKFNWASPIWPGQPFVLHTEITTHYSSLTSIFGE